MNSLRVAQSSVCAVALLLLGGLSPMAAADVPDLSGIWQIVSPQSSFKPVDGDTPFTEQGRKQYEENQRDEQAGHFSDYDISRSRCASPGMPRTMLTPKRFEIFQRPGFLLMAFQWNRLRRFIALPGLPPQTQALGAAGAADVGTMMGSSTGHWEGRVLVVNTDDFSDATLIDALVPHGYDLKLVEHLRLRGRNTLEDRITIQDPEYFTRPWDTVVTYKRQPEAIVPEEVCLDQLLGPPQLPSR